MVGNPDQLNALVLDAVRENHAKLVAAQASERHLFLWLTDTYPDAEWAFSTLPPPPAPSIPSDLDVVWLARYASPIHLWRLRPPDGWEPVDNQGRGQHRQLSGRVVTPLCDSASPRSLPAVAWLI